MVWNKDNLEILTSYLKMGLTRQQIAIKMNFTYDSIDKAITRYNLAQYHVTNVKSVDKLDLTTVKDSEFEKIKEEAKLKWKIATTKIPKNKPKPFKTYLIMSDQHIPHHDQESITAILKLMDETKFDGNILLGDFLDYGCISHWTKNKRKTLEMQRLKNDYITGNVILDEIDKRLPKGCDKHFFKGNHEVWVNDLLEEIPQLEGLIEPESQLKLIERGYKVHDYNKIIPIGRLNFTHGIYATSNSVKKHIDELKTNIIFGHTHTIAEMMSSSPARELAFAGYNVGCLCNLAPDYMRGRPHGWSHGFAIAYFYPDGYFDVTLVRIINGKFIYNGKVYQGK